MDFGRFGDVQAIEKQRCNHVQSEHIFGKNGTAVFDNNAVLLVAFFGCLMRLK